MLAALLLAVAGPSLVAANDYWLEQNWLCRPDRRDACSVDQATSRVDPDGTITRENFQPAAAPNVDCFYVYPTTSLDAAPNSDMFANQEEWDRVASQFARFASVCRTFAPIHRQVSLTALRANLNGAKVKADPALAYRDIVAAWRSYLAHDNHGRPFVLIGHSQGANLLKKLIAKEIDGKPVQRRMLSAMLAGTSLLVPTGKDVGGDFKSIPLCRSVSQTGCAIAWASYRDSVPPPANALFGVSPKPGLEAACTNPARLEGGAALLDSYFGFPWWRGGVSLTDKPVASWKVGDSVLTTRFARVPGRLSGSCLKGAHANYLSVHINGEPQTPFDHEIADKANVGDDAYPDWGFHVIDIAIVQGDLLRLVSTQSAAWHKRRGT